MVVVLLMDLALPHDNAQLDRAPELVKILNAFFILSPEHWAIFQES